MKLHGKKMFALILSLAMLVSVFSVNAFALGDTEEYNIKDYEIKYTGRYTDKVYLDEILAEELAYELSADIDDWYFWTEETESGKEDSDFILGYGDISYKRSTGEYTYTIDLDITDDAAADLEEYGELYENRIYYWAVEDDYYEYEGYIDLVIVGDAKYDLEYDLDGETELYLGEYLAKDLDELLSSGLDYVEFELDNDNDCGDLYYWDDYYDELEDFDESEEYFYRPDGDDYYDLENIYFEPDGSEGEFIIYYTAYGMSNWDEIEGMITIYCGEGLLLEIDINSDEYYTFDSSDFQDAVDKWNDSYSLVYIDNVKLADSDDGALYYDYDEDSKRNTTISDKEEYYVDNDADDLLDSISFVPAKSTKDTVVVNFDALVEKNNGRSDETLAGVLKINVDKAADITIKVGVCGIVEIDWEVFQEYLEEDIDSNDYDVAYVVISNAPRTEQTGYLICDGDDLTSRGDKAFYIDPSRTQYDLENLSYMGGSQKGTYNATFKVYYYKNATSTRASSTNDGTISFVVDASNTIENPGNPLKAAQVLPFSYDLDDFASLGDNDNVCIEFTSLPKGGKLYCNYGLPTQKDVTVGTEYYITSASGKQLLKNVTFVPSYSTDKTPKIISFGVKGYNKNDKAVTGTVNISVVHAYSSLYFPDITGSLYADSVDFLKNRGITEGVPGGKYDANGSLTRAQVVTFLYRAAGSPAVYGTTTFKDVPKGEYYYNAVLWASQNGVTKGRSDTVFDPNATVTNAEVIQFMYNFDVNYLKHTSYVAGSIISVTDYAKVGDWATTAVKWAVGKGVLTPGYLYPTTVGTRGNIALYLHRMLTL